MKRTIAVFAGLMLATSVAMADRYQKTGTVSEVSDKSISIQTEKEGKWEFARDAGTKVEGDLKKGAKVTVHYGMTASKVEVKGAPKKDEKKKK